MNSGNNSADGSIVKRAWELNPEKALEMANLQGFSSSFIGTQEALNKALTDAGFAEAEVTVTEISIDMDDALRVYEVSLLTASAEYEYDIDAVSGAVCGVSVEHFAENETVRPAKSRRQVKRPAARRPAARPLPATRRAPLRWRTPV